MPTKILKKEDTKVTTRIDEILKRPYARILTPDPNGKGYTAEVLEFPGCIAEGDTPQEAYVNLEEITKSWVESTLKQGQNIPEPSTSQGFAGKIALRLPRTLHRKVVQMAERDGTSLNQFLLTAVSERVGAANLYARMIEQLNQQTATMIVSVKSTNVAITHNYTVGSQQFQLPQDFNVNFDAIYPALPYSTPRVHEGNQQNA